MKAAPLARAPLTSIRETDARDRIDAITFRLETLLRTISENLEIEPTTELAMNDALVTLGMAQEFVDELGQLGRRPIAPTSG